MDASTRAKLGLLLLMCLLFSPRNWITQFQSIQFHWLPRLDTRYSWTLTVSCESFICVRFHLAQFLANGFAVMFVNYYSWYEWVIKWCSVQSNQVIRSAIVQFQHQFPWKNGLVTKIMILKPKFWPINWKSFIWRTKKSKFRP